MYHGENFKKMTQYCELDIYFDIIMPKKNSHFLYKHNDIVSVEGSSIVLYVECLGGMFIRECF